MEMFKTGFPQYGAGYEHYQQGQQQYGDGREQYGPSPTLNEPQHPCYHSPGPDDGESNETGGKRKRGVEDGLAGVGGGKKARGSYYGKLRLLG